jgi:ABC-type multidrug transport system ATPase subunit
MRQRVGIAQALLGNPRILIVDEPTVGLDPEERVRFRNLLSELAHGRLVILSTHIVSDVEAIAEKIAVVRKGRLVRLAAPEELLAHAVEDDEIVALAVHLGEAHAVLAHGGNSTGGTGWARPAGAS